MKFLIGGWLLEMFRAGLDLTGSSNSNESKMHNKGFGQEQLPDLLYFNTYTQGVWQILKTTFENWWIVIKALA